MLTKVKLNIIIKNSYFIPISTSRVKTILRKLPRKRKNKSAKNGRYERGRERRIYKNRRDRDEVRKRERRYRIKGRNGRKVKVAIKRIK